MGIRILFVLTGIFSGFLLAEPPAVEISHLVDETPSDHAVNQQAAPASTLSSDQIKVLTDKIADLQRQIDEQQARIEAVEAGDDAQNAAVSNLSKAVASNDLLSRDRDGSIHNEINGKLMTLEDTYKNTVRFLLDHTVDFKGELAASITIGFFSPFYVKDPARLKRLSHLPDWYALEKIKELQKSLTSKIVNEGTKGNRGSEAAKEKVTDRFVTGKGDSLFFASALFAFSKILTANGYQENEPLAGDHSGDRHGFGITPDQAISNDSIRYWVDKDTLLSRPAQIAREFLNSKLELIPPQYRK